MKIPNCVGIIMDGNRRWAKNKGMLALKGHHAGEEKTKDNSGPHIYLALNYGGRQEILSAVKKIVAENPKQEDITEEYLAKYLQTGDMPDPDIIIRTSGEMRLSGFLPWQGVYSELFFTPAMWPDFSK